MSLPAILPTMFGTALGPPFGGVGAKLTVLTAGSGNWRPHPKAGRVLVMATGPGGTGVTNSYSGGAGATAIKMLDLTQLSGQDIPYVVGAAGSGVATTIAGITAGAGSGLFGGSASGGDMHIPGGCGVYVPVVGVTVSVSGRTVTISLDKYYTELGAATGASLNTVSAFSSVVTKGTALGGASFWGGCDQVAAQATVYGAGGPADLLGAYSGAPGVIYILGDLSDG